MEERSAVSLGSILDTAKVLRDEKLLWLSADC